jgi:DNA-binding SARP family transcriptional activator
VLEFRLLGPLEIREGERLVTLPRRKQRALLSALAIRSGQSVSAERLVDDLWAEGAPRTAGASLQNVVSQLRRLLGDGVIVTRPPGYALEVRPEQVDMLLFEQLLEQARGAPAGERVELLGRALGLVRGPPLFDVALEAFAQPTIALLEEREIAAWEALIDAELELGRHAQVVPRLETIVGRYPYREHPRAQLMLALYRGGRQAEALAVYRDVRTLLVDELGIEPGDELQELERAILRQEPALRGRPAAAPSSSAPRPIRESRRTITVLFSDLGGLGAPALGGDPESLRTALDRCRDTARRVVERHGGAVDRLVDGALTAVFGVPAVREDDARRAVHAAVELRAELESSGRLPRFGLGTGVVFVSGEHGALATGTPVTVAEQLGRGAAPGEIVLSGETVAVVRDVVTAAELDRALSGSEVTTSFRLVDFDAGAVGRALRLDAPLIGREHELASLVEALRSASVRRTCHLFSVLGEPGLGKSRLTREFSIAGEEEARVLTGRCLPPGEGSPLSPLVDAFTQAVAAGDLDAEQAASLGLEEALDETSRRVRELLEPLAAEEPLVLVLEDLHHAAPTFLELVETVAARMRNSPILVVATARPQLLEMRPTWGGGLPNATSLRLEPLGPEDSAHLIGSLLPDADLPEPVLAHLVEAADGNPLFVEELLGALVDRSVLRREGGRWTTQELPVLSIPPTVQAVIAERLDRVPDAERVVLEIASVEGRTFTRRTLELLSQEVVGPRLEAALQSLMRRELIGEASPAGDVFAFRHRLIRDVAYDSMPKRRRAELHETFAELLEPLDSVEPFAFHLEQAVLCRREIGADDARTAELVMRAAGHLELAAGAADVRGDEVAGDALRARATTLRTG